MSRILIVEDEVLIGLMLEDMLAMMVHQVVGNAVSVAEAREIISQQPFDLAILDVHVGEVPVFDLAEELAARHVALVFATGSSSDALPLSLQGHTLLQKPYAFDAVTAALDSALK